ncbi:hypothetical protein PAPYR_10523 [Paratrimastix pyriformis]|uniref:Ubiquitinyl hydrolase 1 n=1 Tax=Paratrimastix pyriformis TaxID=342808 RepID=A0ABQ8U5S1_9EUKA|nr:hypothetical protein PAPYR_10523 [Paratrimastix pyriformis]
MHAGLVHRSDHWWAIVRRGQSWVTLDSFKGTEVRPDGAAYIRKIMAPGPRREEPPAIIAPSTQGSTPIKSTAPRHASSPKYRKTANHDWPRHYAWNSTMFREPTFRNKLLKHLRHMTQTDPHPQKITDATCFNQKGVIYVIVDLAKRKFYVDTLYTGRNHNDKFRRAATPREIYWIQRMKSGIPDGYNVAFSHRYARSRRAPRAPKRMRDPGPHQRQSGPVFTVSDDSTQISLEPGENVKLRHRLNVLLKMTDKTKRGNLLGTWKPRTIAGTLRWIQEHIPIVQRAKDVAILEDQLHAHIDKDSTNTLNAKETRHPGGLRKWKEAVMTRCRKNYSGSARTQEQPTYSDKAAHDLAICCRQWYLQKLRDELLNARVYQQSREAKEEIIVRHRAKAEEFQVMRLELTWHLLRAFRLPAREIREYTGAYVDQLCRGQNSLNSHDFTAVMLLLGYDKEFPEEGVPVTAPQALLRKVGGRLAWLRAALRDACVYLARECHTEEPKQWQWGTIHPMVIKHPFAVHKTLGPLFSPAPFPCPGDMDTPCPGRPLYYGIPPISFLG